MHDRRQVFCTPVGVVREKRVKSGPHVANASGTLGPYEARAASLRAVAIEHPATAPSLLGPPQGLDATVSPPRTVPCQPFVPMALRVVCSVLLSVGFAGCGGFGYVTVYEPQRGMRTPTVVQRKANILAETRIALRCLEPPAAGPIERLLSSNEAREMCDRLRKALQDTGASPEIVGALPLDDEESAAYDLTVEWQVVQEHVAHSPWMAAASVLTCTFLPTIDQRTYLHRATVRGRDRNVLQVHESRARFIDYEGVGVWLITWALDLLRDDDHKVGDLHSRRRYSQDLYTQLTQTLVNARARSDLLGLTPRSAKRAIPSARSSVASPPATSTDALPTSTAPTSAPPTAAPPTSAAPTTAPPTAAAVPLMTVDPSDDPGDR